ncbi:TIR domain-containing protein [Kribbella endophytica]
MSRRVFVSYQHADQLKAKGFNLMRYNKALNLNFVGRHLLDPVKSNDATYISRKIREQIKHTSVTVVIIGDETHGSDWVSNEIAWSLEKERPNAIIGIRLSPDVPMPQDLIDCGAEILNWYKPEDVREFGPAIERAANTNRRMADPISNSTNSCSR